LWDHRHLLRLVSTDICPSSAGKFSPTGSLWKGSSSARIGYEDDEELEEPDEW
jgi:hypothetical protein